MMWSLIKRRLNLKFQYDQALYSGQSHLFHCDSILMANAKGRVNISVIQNEPGGPSGL